jgi:hypothetical protein
MQFILFALRALVDRNSCVPGSFPCAKPSTTTAKEVAEHWTLFGSLQFDDAQH